MRHDGASGQVRGDRRSRGQHTRKSMVRFDVHSGQRAVRDWLASRLTFFHAAPRIAPLITNTVSSLFPPLSPLLPPRRHLPPSRCLSLCPPSSTTVGSRPPFTQPPSPASAHPLLPLRYPFESLSRQFSSDFVARRDPSVFEAVRRSRSFCYPFCVEIYSSLELGNRFTQVLPRYFIEHSFHFKSYLLPLLLLGNLCCGLSSRV